MEKKMASSSNTAPPAEAKSGVEVHWQASIKTQSDGAAFMCMNELGADVFLKPMLSSGAIPKAIPAHKFVLSMRSSVFGKMFFYDGANGVTKNEGPIQMIELPDIEEEALKEFLCFLYRDKVELTDQNVMSILYTANKYDVPPLVNRCSTFVIENVCAANAFEMLAMARKHGYESIAKTCLETACKEAKAAVRTQGFYGLDQSILCEFASQEELSIDEYDLFDAMYTWALSLIKRDRGLAQGMLGMRVRQLLGPALFLVRFTCMDLEVIAKKIVPLKVLTADELVQVFSVSVIASEFGSGDAIQAECPFPMTPRKGYVLDIEIPLKNINSSSRTPEVCGNTMGINWKVSVLPRPNYYCNQLRIYYNQMMVYVSSTAAASSMKQSSYTEVTLGLKHVKGGGYNKKLSSTVHHCITAPEENPFKLTFIIADIARAKSEGYIADDGSACMVFRVKI